MNSNISFDSLPSAVMELTEKVDYVISLLNAKIEKREEIPKYLDTGNALAYLKRTGFAMSKSKLYKLTASREIPVHKNGNTLLFVQEELDRWCESRINEEPTRYNFINNYKLREYGNKKQ